MRISIPLTFSMLLFSVFLFGQRPEKKPFSFGKSWDVVDQLIAQQLPQSAKSTIETIYDAAVAEGNEVEQVKAFIWLETQAMNPGRVDEQNPVARWNAEIAKVSVGNQALLSAYLGEYLMEQLRSKRWAIRNRMPGTADKNDMNTWDIGYFNGQIDSCFRKALANPGDLGKISSKAYKPMFDEKPTTWEIRPTLLDLIAHKALDFYKNDGLTISPFPICRFEDEPSLFRVGGPVDEMRVFKNSVLAIFFQLETFHEAAGNRIALFFSRFSRIQYAYKTLDNLQYEKHYVAALDSLSEWLGESPYQAEILEQKAQVLLQLANQYDRSELTENLRMHKAKAAVLLQKAADEYASTEAGKRCYNQLVELQRSSLKVITENYILPNKPFALSVGYRNVKEVEVTVYKISSSDYLSEQVSGKRYNENSIDVRYPSATAVAGNRYSLIEDGDYRKHSTELLCDALPLGCYLAVVRDANSKEPVKTMVPFQVTGIMCREQSFGEESRLSVLRGLDGEPIPEAGVEMAWQYKGERKSASYRCDGQGEVGLAGMSYYRMFATITSGRDSAVFRISGNRYHPQAPKVKEHLWFFTDRSIYRPGQSLYFKAILMQQGDSVQAVANKEIEVIVRDRNYRAIDTMVCKTNQYGSIYGVMRLPEDLMAGNLSLNAAAGNHHVRIENYRRPTFEVKIDPMAETPTLGDEVILSGMAQTFSGIALQGVSGEFTVARSSHFGWWTGLRYQQPISIAKGEFVTDSDGKFTIRFVAEEPIENVILKSSTFRFDVQVDVTDLSGESQHAAKSITIGQIPLQLSLEVDDVINLAEKRYEKGKGIKVHVGLKNSDNEEIEEQVSIDFYKLRPQNALRRRLWPQPDRPLYPKSEWQSAFTGNQYDESYGADDFEVEKKMARHQVNLANRNWTFLSSKKLKPGLYKIVATVVDGNGKETKSTKLIGLIHPKKKGYHFAEQLYADCPVDEAHPGDMVSLFLGSDEATSWQIILENRKGITRLEPVKSEDGVIVRNIKVDETMQGGFSIFVSAVRNGRQNMRRFQVDVPWESKKLQLQTAGFPEQLEPGAFANWQVMVVDEKGNPCQAELAGVVYDASLDQILPHDWKLRFWASHGARNRIQFPAGTTSRQGNASRLKRKSIDKVYSPILMPFFNGRNQQMRIRGVSSIAKSADVLIEVDSEAEEGEVLFSMQTASGRLVPEVTLRSDFRETAWFESFIETNEQGGAQMRFKLPQSATRWKFMALAHTPDGKSGLLTQHFKTVRDFMVEPFSTRFLIEQDKVSLPLKITNQTDKQLSGRLIATFRNVETDELLPANALDGGFVVKANSSTVVNWQVEAPGKPGIYRITVIGNAGELNDGYKLLIPVMPRAVFTTESHAFSIPAGKTQSLPVGELLAANGQPEGGTLSLELMSNPVWLAIDALPVAQMTASAKSPGGIASRLFSSALARQLMYCYPAIGEEIERRKLAIKNEESSTMLERGKPYHFTSLEQTPWFAHQLMGEKQLSFFEVDSLTNAVETCLNKLKKLQNHDGGFSWFPGMQSSEWITASVLEEFAMLKNFGVFHRDEESRLDEVVNRAMDFLASALAKEYGAMDATARKNYVPGGLAVNVLFTHALLNRLPAKDRVLQPMVDFYLKKFAQKWNKTGLWNQIEIAHIMATVNNEKILARMMKSFRERAIRKRELGMYWPTSGGHFFYRQPSVALHTRMMELFAQLPDSDNDLDAMRLWLLQQKRTHGWANAYQTTRAVNAMMLRIKPGELSTTLPVVKVNGKTVSLDADGGSKGLVTVNFTPEDLADLKSIEIKNAAETILFGGLHHQYFKASDLAGEFGDKLSIEKKLFKLKRTESGDSLVADLSDLKPGDLVKIRLRLEADRNLGYVSLKDERPAGTEPVKQRSGYESQGNLWYYREIADTDSRFHLEHLSAGVHVIEYLVRVSHTGDFSAGRATVQCYFAPEFNGNASPGRVIFE